MANLAFMRKLSASAVLALLLAMHSGAQNRSYVARCEKFCEDSLSRLMYNRHISVNWIGGGSRRFWYTSENAEGKTWWLGDTRTGRQRRMFDTADMVSRLNALGEDMTAESFGLWNPEFNASATAFEFDSRKKRYIYDIGTGSLKEIPAKEKARRHESVRGDWKCRYSADSLFYMTASGDNLALYPTPPAAFLR